MRPRLPILLSLVSLLLALPLLAEVPAGRQLVLLRNGVWVGSDVITIEHHSAAFDGQRFLAVGVDEHADITVALLEEGAATPSVTATIPASTQSQPRVRWDGTRYVILWNEESTAHGAFVSAQGVVERSFALPLIRRFDDFIATPDRIAVLAHGETENHWTLDLAFLGADARLQKTTRLGMLRKSSGFGTTYHGGASLVRSGSGYYAAWTAHRSGRNQSVVGTRITADGEPLDLEPYKLESESIEGRMLYALYAMSLYGVEAYSFGENVIVLARTSSSGPAAILVRPDGSSSPGMNIAVRDWLDTTVLRDGTIALVLSSPYRLSTFLKPSPPPARRRFSRH